MRELWLPIYFPSFLMASGQQAVLVLLPLYALELGGGPALAATLLALRGGGSLVSNIPAGLLVGRFGGKAVMVAALSLLTAIAVWLGQATSLAGIGLLAVCFGAASGAWLLARVVYVSEAAPLAQRGRALAGLGAVQRGGTLLGPLAGGLLVTGYGYELAFAAAGGCALLSCLLVLGCTHGSRPGAGSGRTMRLSSIGAILRDHHRTFATAGLATVGLTVLRSGRQLLLPLFGAAIGLNEAQIGLVFTLSSGLEILMAYPGGTLLDRRGHKAVALPCFGLLIVGILLLPWVEGWWSLVGVALIAAIGNGLGSGMLMTMGSDYAPAAQRGEFLGVWRILGDSGQVAGPVLIGAVAAAVTLGAASVAVALVGVTGLGLMVALVKPPIRE